MKIQRYTHGTYNNDPHMFPTDDGHYVKLEDHEKIVQELKDKLADVTYELKNAYALWSED